ncbi:MAG: hypothetical protein ABSF23_18020 [Terracidiphilus sp.]|jgi:hypothetical protein
MANGLGFVRSNRSLKTLLRFLSLAAAFSIAAPAQHIPAPAASTPPPPKARTLSDRFPERPSRPPAITIPVDPLGFVAPGAYFLGSRNSLASLDFLGEDRLLFTFRVPGLLHRDLLNGEDSDERRIRALVLSLPQGAIEAEAAWTVHDRTRYLWALNNGRFLLRDRNNLFEGDASLKLKPLLDFPGSLLWIEFDPAQKFLVTNSREPVAKSAASGAPQALNPSTAAASVTTDQDSTAPDVPPDLVVRILRRDTGQVMLVSRVRAAVHLPINSQGYVENLRVDGPNWLLNLGYFTGGSRLLGHVQSTCEPVDDFLTENVILASACGPTGESTLVALTTAGQTLWITRAPLTEVWPLHTIAANGSRLAWETLDTSHPVDSLEPIQGGDIKGQSVTILDAATGDIALVSPVSPILDAGGNVAISPSGRRVALLNAGAIQIFDLPPPAPLPTAADSAPISPPTP